MYVCIYIYIYIYIYEHRRRPPRKVDDEDLPIEIDEARRLLH